jgi:hypothetical protein
MSKTVIGTARKAEDIRRIYELAASRVAMKGRLTDQGRVFTAYLEEIFTGTELDAVPFQTAVEYIKEAADGDIDNLDKVKSSLRAFLNTNAAKTNFRTVLDGRTLMIERTR